ncbi:MAG: THUMP domain-containing protein [Nitrososphaerales archaeon]
MVRLTLLMRCVVKPSAETAAQIDLLKHLLIESLPSFTDSKYSIKVKGDIIEVEAQNLVEVAETISRFSGVAYVALAERVNPEFDEVLQAIVRMGKKGIFEKERFMVKVETTQNLNFEPKDLESLATSILIGEVSDRGAKPDEKKPDKVVYALVTKEDAYIFTHRYLGSCGLPCGSLGECVIVVEPTVRSLVNAWLTQRAGFDAKYIIINQPQPSSKLLYHSFEVFTLLRRCMPKKIVQVFYVDAANRYRTGDGSYSWFEFTATLALKAAKETNVNAVSLPLILGGSATNVVERACRESVTMFSPASFLTNDEMLCYARMIGLHSKLQIDLNECMLSMLDASGRTLSSLEDAARDAWKDVVRLEVAKGLLDAHEIVDSLS